MLIITDTNVFIDLENAGLIDNFLVGSWQVATTDFALGELDDLTSKKVKTYKVGIKGLNEKGIRELKDIEAKNGKVSVVDISVLLLAEKLNGVLLSGDKELIKLCTNRKKAESHGIFWILEKMLEINTITYKQAYEGLLKIVSKGSYLPRKKVDEYLKKWKALDLRYCFKNP